MECLSTADCQVPHAAGGWVDGLRGETDGGVRPKPQPKPDPKPPKKSTWKIQFRGLDQGTKRNKNCYLGEGIWQVNGLELKWDKEDDGHKSFICLVITGFQAFVEHSTGNLYSYYLTKIVF